MQLSNLTAPKVNVPTPKPVVRPAVIVERKSSPKTEKAGPLTPAHRRDGGMEDKLLSTAIEQLKEFPDIYKRLTSWD